MSCRFSTMGSTDAVGSVPNEFMTKLNYYLRPEDGGSDVYMVGSGNDPTRNKYESAEVRVKNARCIQSSLTLDKHGFQILNGIDLMKSSDTSYLSTDFYPVVAKNIQDETGASEVLITRPIQRVPRPNYTIPISYATFVHVDESYDGARDKYLFKYPQFAERFEKSRWAVINWWQPFQVPATRTPLALCDGGSVADEDWCEITATRRAANHIPAHGMWRLKKPRDPDAHKWYYFKDMQLDEAVLIKIFDSKKHGVSRRTPHSAFDSPFDYGPERTSVEFRCVLFWDDQPLDG